MNQRLATATLATFATFAAFGSVARADDPEPPPKVAVSGLVDTTFNYNFNRPASGTNALWSYSAQHDTFALNNAHIAITGEAGALSFALEVDAGTDAMFNQSYQGAAPKGGAFDIQEAYGAYKKDKFGFRAGKFVTYMGIEVIENPLNPTVSRGFLFGLAEPATHVGAEVMFQVSPQVDLHVGVVNGWDQLVDNNRGKTALAKLGIALDKATITMSGYVGPERPGSSDLRITGDVTAVVKAGDSCDLGLQLNGGTEDGAAPAPSPGTASWVGAGVQPIFHLADKLDLGARFELFSDMNGGRTGLEQTLFNLTVAPAYKVTDHLTLRAEGRLDHSDLEIYDHSDGSTDHTQLVMMGEAFATF